MLKFEFVKLIDEFLFLLISDDKKKYMDIFLIKMRLAEIQNHEKSIFFAF